jgi:hypothetical protein
MSSIKRFLLGWLRRFLGYCPECGTLTRKDTTTVSAGVFIMSGWRWNCDRCGWWRILWEDGKAEER